MTFGSETGEDGAHAQLAPDALRVDVAVLVAERGAARHHLQLRQGGELVDDPLGDAVAQVLGVRIVRVVL